MFEFFLRELARTSLCQSILSSCLKHRRTTEIEKSAAQRGSRLNSLSEELVALIFWFIFRFLFEASPHIRKNEEMCGSAPFSFELFLRGTRGIDLVVRFSIHL